MISGINPKPITTLKGRLDQATIKAGLTLVTDAKRKNKLCTLSRLAIKFQEKPQ
jgi:hypothetical protein